MSLDLTHFTRHRAASESESKSESMSESESESFAHAGGYSCHRHRHSGCQRSAFNVQCSTPSEPAASATLGSAQPKGKASSESLGLGLDSGQPAISPSESPLPSAEV